MHGRVDGGAGRRDIDGRSVVAVASESLTAGLTIEILEGRDGDHLWVRRGHIVGRVVRIVAGRDDDRDAFLDHVADRFVQRVIIVAPAIPIIVPISDQAHVHHFDRSSIGGNPVEPADHGRPRPAPASVQHLDRVKSHPRSDADHAESVVERADRARDVGAVAVVINWRPAPNAVLPGNDVEIGVIGDAGVDHRHINIHALINTVDPRIPVAIGLHPIHASRQGLARRLRERHWLIAHDVGDLRVSGDPRRGALRKPRGESPDRDAIGLLDSEPVVSRQPSGGSGDVRDIALEDDDVLVLRNLGEARLAGYWHRRERRSNAHDEDERSGQ